MVESIGWQRVASLSQLREDEAFPAKIGDVQIALYTLKGQVYAIDDICTHEYGHLSQGFVEGGIIECPLHQATFDIVTGKCLTAPATVDLNRYAVRVEGNDIFVNATPLKCPAKRQQVRETSL
jgi:nitrite reductase/ring-hydroxylating ferredoxin subunit